jgi:hypothetical protein
MQVTRQRSQVGALSDLAALIALLTTGKAHLYQDDGFVPDSNSLLADFNAHEADFTGYTAGGETMAAPVGPYLDGIDRVAENFPTIAFQPASPFTVTNEIRGAYFEDSNNDVQEYWIFDQPITMASALDIILLDAKFVIPYPSESVER